MEGKTVKSIPSYLVLGMISGFITPLLNASLPEINLI